MTDSDPVPVRVAEHEPTEPVIGVAQALDDPDVRSIHDLVEALGITDEHMRDVVGGRLVVSDEAEV